VTVKQNSFATVIPLPTADQLPGTYRLIGFTRTVVATGETTDIFGKAPQGYITYGRDGRMMVLITSADRPAPADLARVTDQQRADLFKTMLSYSGTYDFDGKVVTHHIDISWNQTWTGTHQLRNVKFAGKKLVLTTDPMPAPTDGQASVIVVTFEKAA
jgi:hypothetical protein